MKNVKIPILKDDGTTEFKDTGIRKDLIDNFVKLISNLDEPYSISQYVFDKNADIMFGIIEKNSKGQETMVYKLKICKHT